MTEQLASSLEADSIDVLLRGLRVSSTVFCQATLGAPWALGVPARGVPAFHVVATGQCWLEVDGETPRRLHAGDLVILPHGDVHWLRDAPGTTGLWLDDLVGLYPVDAELRLRGGGDGAVTELLCGIFAVDGSHRHPVLETLPSVVHLRGAGERPLPWLAATLELISIEVKGRVPGAAAIWERLSEIMLAQAVRAVLNDVRDTEGLTLELLHKRGIAPAVRAIHEQPERPWTLGELSQIASMSRSALAARFRSVTGDSPIRYATRCRLARAAERLRTSNAGLAEIARAAGYESEFSFSRAFKRTFGLSPGAYRERDHSGDAANELASTSSTS